MGTFFEEIVKTGSRVNVHDVAPVSIPSRAFNKFQYFWLRIKIETMTVTMSSEQKLPAIRAESSNPAPLFGIGDWPVCVESSLTLFKLFSGIFGFFLRAN